MSLEQSIFGRVLDRYPQFWSPWIRVRIFLIAGSGSAFLSKSKVFFNIVTFCMYKNTNFGNNKALEIRKYFKPWI